MTAAAASESRTDTQPSGRLLEVEYLVKHFPVHSSGVLRRKVGEVQAVTDISFSLDRGQTLGLVGESGCGKSTTGRTVLQLQPATSGSIRFQGTELTKVTGRGLRRVRRDLQVVFQDPYASLNPRIPVNDIVAEPLIIHGLFKRQGR